MTPNRAACYTRVSTPKQSTDDKESLPAQERACRAYADEHGLEVVKVYVEPGFTATKMERPVFSQLVKDAQAKQFEHLIIDRTDRLTRGGPGHYAVLVNTLECAGVSLHFAMEQFDPNSDEGGLMGAIHAYQNRMANKQRAELRRRTYLRYARDGHYVCGKRPPYGFMFPDERKPDGRLKKDRLIADPITGPIVQQLFEAVARGATLRSQAIWLNQEHVPTPTGRPGWSIPVLSILLRKPIYYGEAGVTLQGERFKYPEGVVEPLIDAETAAVVQTRLAQNRRYSPRTADLRVQPVLIGGRGRCAHCGHALATRREPTRQGKPRLAYWCQWAKAPHTCEGVWALAKEVDQVVWDQLRDYLLNPEKLAELAEQQGQAEVSDDPSSEMQRVKRALADTTRKRDNLYSAVGETGNKDVRAGLLLQVDLAEQTLTALRDDQASLERVALASEARRKTLADVSAWATRYRAVFLLNEPTDPRGREVIRAVFKALHVTVLVSRDPETKQLMVNGTFEFLGPLPYWDVASFGDLNADDLAEFQTALTDPTGVAALASLTARLQSNRESQLSLLRSR